MDPTTTSIEYSEATPPPQRRIAPGRAWLAGVTMIPVGAVAGALAGILGSMVWTGLFRPEYALQPFIFIVAGLFGAPLGAVILPVAGFTILRYVPIGRALWQTLLGTVVGGVIGVQFLSPIWIVCPIGGFLIAATRLRREARRNRLAADLS